MGKAHEASGGFNAGELLGSFKFKWRATPALRTTYFEVLDSLERRGLVTVAPGRYKTKHVALAAVPPPS